MDRETQEGGGRYLKILGFSGLPFWSGKCGEKVSWSLFHMFFDLLCFYPPNLTPKSLLVLEQLR